MTDQPTTRRRAGALRAAGRVLLAVGLLPTAAVDAALLAGGRSPALLAALAAMAVPAVMAGGAVSALALLARRPRALALALAVTAPAGVHGLPPVWHARERARPVAPCRSAPAQPLRVMTVNVELGGAPARDLVDLVRHEHPDLLAVQELTPQLVSDLERAGLDRELPYRHLLPRPSAGGSGLWSIGPIRRQPALTSTRFAGPRARLDVGGVPVEVVVAHPASPGPLSYAVWDSEQRGLAAELARLDDGTPRIVLGDFNGTTGHAAFRALLQRSRLDDAADLDGLSAWPGLTWPADRSPMPPFARIDHVLVSAQWQADDVRTARVRGTDHRALLAVVSRGRVPGCVSPPG
ncbi:MAG: endonuclease/exonuclease/phosphatase family protein [Kineosporiaceae bacterium]